MRWSPGRVVRGGGTERRRRAVEAIGGSTDGDEPSPHALGEQGDFYSGFGSSGSSGPEIPAPGVRAGRQVYTAESLCTSTRVEEAAGLSSKSIL